VNVPLQGKGVKGIRIPIIVIGSTMTASAQAQGNGFNDGFAKAKHDMANNQTYNDSCPHTTKGVYCQQYDNGYKTHWIQQHWSTGTPLKWELLNANSTEK
jgi:hypothetical protein